MPYAFSTTNPIVNRRDALKNVIIEVQRSHPGTADAPPKRIHAQVRRHSLSYGDIGNIAVFSIAPQSSHSEAERKIILERFPFFHRRIITTGDALNAPTGGYLLTPREGVSDKGAFESYFASAEVLLTPTCDTV
jgi:hypothetical protein